MTPLLRSLRPAQWVKNLFVLAPLMFGRVVTRHESLGKAFVTFVAFCAVASALYLLNDVADRESDRLHPLKQKRPIAKGELGVATALCVSGGLLVGALLLVTFRARAALVFVALYAVLTALYSIVLKKVSLLDVFVISTGFVLRVLAGAAAAEVRASHWLLLCTFFVSLFLALSKRRSELAQSGSAARPSLAAVPLPLIESFENVALAITIVCYALYTVSPDTVTFFGSDRLLLTVPFVVFGLFRWRLLEARGGGEDASSDLFTDPGLLLTVVLWGTACAALIYFPR